MPKFKNGNGNLPKTLICHDGIGTEICKKFSYDGIETEICKKFRFPLLKQSPNPIISTTPEFWQPLCSTLFLPRR